MSPERIKELRAATRDMPSLVAIEVLQALGALEAAQDIATVHGATLRAMTAHAGDIEAQRDELAGLLRNTSNALANGVTAAERGSLVSVIDAALAGLEAK